LVHCQSECQKKKLLQVVRFGELGRSRPTVKLSLAINFSTYTGGALLWWINQSPLCHFPCPFCCNSFYRHVASLMYSLSLQNKFCVGQFHACQKDLHTFHTGTSEGVEMIGNLTLKKLLLCFWLININPCFMTFERNLGSYEVFPEGSGILWHDSAFISTLKEWNSWQTQCTVTVQKALRCSSLF
jgi:hypothetical protein